MCHIVEKRPRLLEFADTEMVEALMYHMRDHRATLRLNEEVESVEETPEGKVAANLVSKKRINGDALLYAVGRQGNVDRLDLEVAGIESDDRGRIGTLDGHRNRNDHDEDHRAHLCGTRSHLGQQTHLVEHDERGPPEVDELPTRA